MKRLAAVVAVLSLACLLLWPAAPGHAAGAGVSYDYAQGLLPAGGGSTLVLARSTASAADLPDSVLQVTANGVLDTAFGNGGVARLPENTEAYALARYPDGRILVGGLIGNWETFLARLTADGRRDPTFGVDGVRTYPYTTIDSFVSLLILPDGAIIGRSVSCLVKLDAAGEPDLSFGTGGKALFPAASTVLAGASHKWLSHVAVASDGKLLVSGYVTVITEITPGPLGQSTARDFPCLLRYNPDGTLDAFFGSAGALTWDWPGSTEPAHALPLSDGSLLVSGVRSDGTKLFVLKLGPDGAPDASFGTNGAFSYTPAAWWVYGLNGATLLGNGTLLLQAQIVVFEAKQMEVWHILMVSVTPQGVLDTRYARSGVWTSEPLPHDHRGRAFTLAPYIVPRDAGCVAAVDDLGNAYPDVKLIRFGADGNTVRSFGSRGVFSWDYAP